MCVREREGWSWWCACVHGCVGEGEIAQSIARGDGFLIWFHVASVGEAMSILPLIDNCIKEKKINKILIRWWWLQLPLVRKDGGRAP